MVLERREIFTPRSKRIENAVAGEAIAAIFVAYLVFADTPRWWVWPLAAFFVLNAAAQIFLVFKPAKLVLDEEGFAMQSALRKKKTKTRWRDVECFLVATVPSRRGRPSKYVALKWREGSRDIGRLAKSINRLIGADSYIPMSWPRPHEAIAEELNDYRRQALQIPLSGNLGS